MMRLSMNVMKNTPAFQLGLILISVLGLAIGCSSDDYARDYGTGVDGSDLRGKDGRERGRDASLSDTESAAPEKPGVGEEAAVRSHAAKKGSPPEKGSITVADLVNRDRVGGAVISPDSRKVAYVKLTPDFEKNKYYRDIYVADVLTGESRRFTTDKATDTSPVWSPDSSRILFISSRSGRSQIWEIGLDGGEARQVTDMAVSVSRPVFSADGRKIAFLAKKSPEDEEGEAAKGGSGRDAGKDAGKDAGRIAGKDAGRSKSGGAVKKKGPHDDMKVLSSLEDRETWRHIWIMDLATGTKPRRVTTEPYIYEDLAWSPDGETLAFTYDPKGTRGVSEDSHVGTMPAAGGEIRRLTEEGIFAGAASWSHDGRYIAYLRDRDVELGAYLNVKDLYVCDLESGKSRCLTSGDNVAVGGYSSIPHTPAVWSTDDRSLYLPGAVGPTQNIYRVPAAGGEMAPVTGAGGEIYSATFSADLGSMAFLMGSWTEVTEVYATPVDRFEPKRLTRTMDAIAHLGFRAPETVRFESRDGLEVEGFLFYPDGYVAGARVPLVVDIHGGPASRWGAQIPRYTPWRVYNNLGMAVLIVNPRGSTAYGADFQRGNFKGFGLGDLEDIMAGVDHVIDKGVADPDRLGVTGYSYGGFMTNNIITRTDRFKAAVSIAGGSNYISCYCQGNPVLPRVFYDGAPWGENARLYFEHSPIIRAGAVTTPTLFLHGEKDRAVHVSQSIEFFRALAEAGVTTELVLYPREGHSIYEPCHWRDYMERTIEWFREYL